MNSGQPRWDEVVPTYRRYYELSKGDRKDRLRADDHWWAWEAVERAVSDGSIPLPVLDALVCDPDGDSDYRGYVAAGPLEDVLKLHADTYAAAIAVRGETQDPWTEALRGVWLDPSGWSSLPESLRRIIPEPRPSGPGPSVQAPHKARRPSKRQERRGSKGH